MSIFTGSENDGEPEATRDASDPGSGSKRQRIGALLQGYGAVQGALLGWMFLVALQGADDEMPVLLPLASILLVPGLVFLAGLGLRRDRRWAYFAALCLPLAIVPVGTWWLMNYGRRDRLWEVFLFPLGVGAFLALGTVALSAALLFTLPPRSEP